MKTWCALALLLCAGSAVAEPRVGRILYFGNAVTKEYIIARALQMRSGDPFSQDELELARERLSEITVLEYVEVQPKHNDDDTVDLVVTVDEKPRFAWGMHEAIHRRYGGIYLGPWLRFDNFRGRAEIIEGRASWGALTNYELSWKNPHILGPARLRLFLSGRWARHDFEYEPFRFTDVYGRGGLGRRLLPGIEFDSYYELREVEIDEAKFPWTNGKTRDDAVVLAISHDSRDAPEYPTRGLNATAEARFSSVAQDDPYQLYRFDAAGFWSLPILEVIGGRLGYSMGGQRLPVYERRYLGGPGDLRGVDFGSLEGDRAYIASLEIRRSLLEFPRFHLGLQLFHDWGKAYDHGSEFSEAPLLRGFGFGTHLNIRSRVLRVDWAWDEDGDMRVFAETGFTF